MIVELAVENFAIIERSQVVLGPGFTALTGETGAGKSLVVDAIELALGGRSDAELVRSGASRASVAAVFDLSDRADLAGRCADLGLPVEDGRLYVQREVFAEGRSQCRVGGKLTPVSVLRQVGQDLVDLHGQHDHQSLLNADRHLGFLDDWIGGPAVQLRGEVEGRFLRLEDLKRRLQVLRSSRRDREQRSDMLRFQIAEIEAAAPQEGEMEDLETQLSRLRHAEKLTLAGATALAALREDDRNASDLLGGSMRDLEAAARLDPSLDPVLDPLRSALYSLEEGSFLLRAYVEAIESDPKMLEATAKRIDELKRLRRKYGDDEAAVLQFLEKARSELEILDDSDGSETDLLQAVETASEELEGLCARLTDLRTRKGAEFGERVQSELRDLAMEKAVFDVAVSPQSMDASGADRVEFFFSANLGEPPRPLARIASGGEISRVMLAIKTAMAGRVGVPTLIFDEVDAGLGGRVAAVVARKLEELARHCQVVVISHLPQIAARATTHYRIDKVESGGRAVTQVRALSSEKRVDEIARMLAGEEVGPSAVAHAREMLR